MAATAVLDTSVLSHLARERSSLPDLEPRHIPIGLSLESGSEVDDIEVEMESGGTAWIQAKRCLLPGARRSGASTCLLVDSVDEVGTAVWSTPAEPRRRFSKLVGLVAVSRPTTSSALEDGFEALQLVPWSPVDVERFLATWRGRYALSVVE